jgi:hypothetical protein
MIGEVGEDRVASFKFYLIPSDVRDAHSIGELHDAARQQSQASVHAELVPFIEHHLKAHAEADDRLARHCRLGHQPIETEFAQAVHRITERADSEKHELISCAQYFLITRYNRRNILGCKGLLDAPQVSDSIINDCDFQITPFVDITPSILSSIRTAWERERATDLKAASMM